MHHLLLHHRLLYHVVPHLWLLLHWLLLRLWILYVVGELWFLAWWCLWLSNIPRLDYVVSFGVTAHHVLLCRVEVVHAVWVLFSECLTCMIIGNFSAVCPTVIIFVESFYVFGVYELSGGEMAPPW